MRSRRTVSGRGGRRERGAVFTELVIVVPLLLLLVLGVVEIGFRSNKVQTAVTASRAGARVGSSVGDSRLADYNILQALSGALSDIDAADVERIIVYRASAPNGDLPGGCSSGPVEGECNHYTAADFTHVPADFTTDGPDCEDDAPDWKWCPLDRVTDQSAGADWLGVEVRINHTSVAPFLGDTMLTDRTVMRLEPRFGP